MAVHVGESFMRSVTTSYFMTALSTKGDFCFTQKNLPLWLGRTLRFGAYLTGTAASANGDYGEK